MISRHSFCDHCHDKIRGLLSVGDCFIKIGDWNYIDLYRLSVRECLVNIVHVT